MLINIVQLILIIISMLFGIIFWFRGRKGIYTLLQFAFLIAYYIVEGLFK